MGYVTIITGMAQFSAHEGGKWGTSFPLQEIEPAAHIPDKAGIIVDALPWPPTPIRR
jgi:hypothetical protein